MQHPQHGYGYAPATAYVGGYPNGGASNDNSMTAVNYVPYGYQQQPSPMSAPGTGGAAAPGGKTRRPQAVSQAASQQHVQHPQADRVDIAPYDVYGPHVGQPPFGIAGYTQPPPPDMNSIPAGFAQPYYSPAAGGGRGGRGQGRHSQDVYFGGLMAPSGQYAHAPPGTYYWPTSYQFSGNNAVPEKTPTIYMRHPETGKVLGVKLNRVLDTLAGVAEQVEAQRTGKTQPTSEESNDPEEGVNTKAESTAVPELLPALTNTKLRLCPHFSSSQGCPNGSCCTDVHTAGREYLWETIAAKTVTHKDDKTGAPVTTYAPGFLVRCFDPTLTHYYEIPSESVIVNKGSEDYIRMFNFNGNNFKKKFKVYTSAAEAPAERIADSGEIYCTLESLESVADKLANTTHVNDGERMLTVARLPDWMMVRVYDQNNYERYKDYPGSLVLMTEGAKSYAKMYAQSHNSIPIRKRMQHCAHFRLHNMCRLGSQCRFVHVLRTLEEAAAAKLKEQKKQNTASSFAAKAQV